MIVNRDIITKFNPCTDRLNNYTSHYKDFTGSFDDFLDLENISYNDKIWVAKKLLNKNQLVHFGLLCAESVLVLYENKYPDNKAPRELIEYMQTIKDFSKMTVNELDTLKNLRSAAYAAADDAYAAAAAYAAADAAAYAAADAAAYADATAYAAADAAAYAADAYADAAAYAAAADDAYAADAYADARTKQQNHNITLLKMAASL